MKIAVYTLGCKLNQCESEAIADAFVKEGFTLVSPMEQEAQLYVINTCTVTSKAEQKARRMIRKFASENQNPIVLVTGCYAQLEKKVLEKLGEKVVVYSLDDKPALLEIPRYLNEGMRSYKDPLWLLQTFHCAKLTLSPFDYDPKAFSSHSRAFLKIQDGCDNACAYCRVTIARGSAVSLAVDEVLSRAIELESHDYHEIVLTGVNISAYKSKGLELPSLLRLLDDSLGPYVQIRLSSLEPDRLDSALVDACALERVVPHFHIPIQTASNRVLKRVNREYTIESVAEAVQALSSVKNDPFLAADIIAGLPGETEEDFMQTYRFVQDMHMSQLHVFPFSPRPQTPLFYSSDKIPEYIRDRRAQQLREASSTLYQTYLLRQIGRTVRAIVEETNQKGVRVLTENYMKAPLSNYPSHLQKGELITVKLSLAYQQQTLCATFIDFYTPL